jgi:ligand-binding SRPBCC domain-containing protein
MEYPAFFEDVMQKGAFKTMQHRHTFIKTNERSTLMKDNFVYTVPFGSIGRWVDALVLQKYMTRFLVKRNEILKQTAESGEWKKFL